MKFQPDKTSATLITSVDSSGLTIGQERITHSLVLGSHGERMAWSVRRFEELTSDHFSQLAKTKPEMIIFGSGPKLQFPQPKLMAALMQARIGVESMDTPAACRTYNILASEGRHVLGAFLIEGD